MKKLLLILVLLVSGNAIGQDINPNGWDHAAFTHPYHNQNTGNYILVGDRTGSGHTWCDTDIVPFARGGQISVHRIWNDRGGNAILNLHGGTDWATAPFNYVIVDEASRASFASNMDNTRGYFLAPENDPNTPRTIDPCYVFPAWPQPLLENWISDIQNGGSYTQEQVQDGDYNQQSRRRPVVYTYVRAATPQWFADTIQGDTVGIGEPFATEAEARAEATRLATAGTTYRPGYARVSWRPGYVYNATADGVQIITEHSTYPSTNTNPPYPFNYHYPAVPNPNFDGIPGRNGRDADLWFAVTASGTDVQLSYNGPNAISVLVGGRALIVGDVNIINLWLSQN